jgi:hypothetical protein
MSLLQHARQIAGLAIPLAAALFAPSADAQGGTTAAAKATAGSSWVIFPSEDVIYRYYPKYQSDHGIAGMVEISCRVRGRRDLERCAIRSESPKSNGFGEAAVRMAEAEFHLLQEPTGTVEPGATVSIRIDFTPRAPSGSAPLAGSGAQSAAVGPATVGSAAVGSAAVGSVGASTTDDPAAVVAWGRSIQPMNWQYSAPGQGQMAFWGAASRISPTIVRGRVRYEDYAPVAAALDTVRSSVVTYEFDCAAHAYRTLAVTTHVQANLSGPAREMAIGETSWQKLISDSVLEDAASRICQFDARQARGAANMAETSASPSKR